MKEGDCSHKLRYDGYPEQICRCLLNDMYIELINMRISYKEITCIYGEVYVTVV